MHPNYTINIVPRPVRTEETVPFKKRFISFLKRNGLELAGLLVGILIIIRLGNDAASKPQPTQQEYDQHLHRMMKEKGGYFK